MTLRLAFRIGLPMSFVYCTLDQGIWTKGSDKLIEEQKDVWGRAIKQTVHYYHTIVSPNSDIKSDSKATNSSKFELPNQTCLKKKWNCAVRSSFNAIERFLDEPQKPILGLYDKMLSYSYTTEPTQAAQQRASK